MVMQAGIRCAVCSRARTRKRLLSVGEQEEAREGSMLSGNESVVVTPRRVRIDERATRAVEQKLVRLALLTGEEENQELYSPSDLIIGTAPNAEAFSRWASGNRKFLCDFIGGKIIARELPHNPHGQAQLKVGAAFDAQAGGLLVVATAVTYKPDFGGDLYEPDVTVQVRGQSSILPPGVTALRTYGAIVIEIATSQTPKNLHERAAIFLGPDYPRCELYIGLKRFNERANGTIAMLASVYERPGAGGGAAGAGGGARGGGPMPIRLVSFGTCPLGPNATWRNSPILTRVGHGGLALNGPGLASYILCFPAPQVFTTFVPPGGGAVGVPPAGAPVNYELDLYYIQQAFLCPFEPTY
ncbi:uncharacterized protein LOC112344615 [Selaginella moellendorffii]|uniref:uncharacterized protein LOC112344615 n=1 Tax=Selaginella moellendorffii TaxID=88036 RepID=UPI000D1CD927|nr:uncharacterized protein LOC112344615 [Selaginella moellendorffii]|eukprot:XP_024525456.1 uncharacterized protein LOC112344615 [Selaginella moellendorffii]